MHNFKSYDDGVFILPKPTDYKNIVLIGAKNGHGKTTLLEAICLGLYDEDAIVHLSRAGLGEGDASYPAFIKKALHANAVLEFHGHQYEISISITKKTHQAWQA